MRSILEDVELAIANVTPQPDVAGPVHAAVMNALERRGFFVVPEYRIDYERNDGEWKTGKIDLVVRRGIVKVAIEIDARRPRLNSIRKLRAFDGLRVCILRGVDCEDVPLGIDAVLSVPVRFEAVKGGVTRRRVAQ